MNSLYPLKFNPIFKEKIWGGQKIKTIFNKNFSPLPNCGESWELSGVEENISVVSNGFLKGNNLEEIAEIYMCDLLGEKNYEKYGTQFPILVKFIDSNDWLSLQVHPNDALAMKRHKQNGKSEMWYILHAEKNAQLISGFNKELSEKTYLEKLNNGSLSEVLNYEKAVKGDVFYVPAGRIHALGPGICLAEIQQTSDVTYRIHDWGRVDDKGNSRELHTEQSLEAIDFKRYDDYKLNGTKVLNQSTNMVKSPHFTSNIIAIDKPYVCDYYSLDSFVIYVCTEGKFKIIYENGEESVQMGETVLIPATLSEIKIIPEEKATILEVFIES